MHNLLIFEESSIRDHIHLLARNFFTRMLPISSSSSVDSYPAIRDHRHIAERGIIRVFNRQPHKPSTSEARVFTTPSLVFWRYPQTKYDTTSFVCTYVCVYWGYSSSRLSLPLTPSSHHFRFSSLSSPKKKKLTFSFSDKKKQITHCFEMPYLPCLNCARHL